MQRSFVDDNDMGTGTIPAYMTSTLPGFNQQWSPFSPNALHHKQSLNAASPLAANTSGQGMDEDGSEGSDSYVEMDEFASPNEIPKKKYSKRRKSRKSSQKHSGQREPRAAPDIPKKPSRNSPLSASPQANPYLEPTGMSMRRDVSNMFIASSKEMTLGEFVTKHQHEFPVRVRVSRGFYGMTDRWSISEGEYFNIHFVKYTKVVSATDGGSGHYNIPVNSAVEFASLYAPDGKVESGLQGFSFTTARDVTIQSKVPQILRALKSCIRPGVPAASVNANELLVVKKVKKPFFGSRVLHCTDLLTGEKKALPANCVGQFTTKPFLVRLFLPEVIQHLTLPGKFVMFLNPDTSCDLPEDLFSSAITLSHCSIETSLVATQLESTDPRDNPLLEIPIDLDIGVELVTPKAEELAQLFEDTQEIYANFDISHVKSIPSNAASIDVNPDVTKAVKTTRLGKENMGIQLQQPPRYSLAGSRDYNLTLEPLMPKPVASSHHHKKSRKTHSVDEGERVAVLESQVCQMAEQIKGQKTALMIIIIYSILIST